MPETRPAIPIETQRLVLFESRHHCAVCCNPLPLEQAHVMAWKNSKDHSVENLIALCANCHSRADHEDWGAPALEKYKKNPCILARISNAPALSNAAIMEHVEMVLAMECGLLKERVAELESKIGAYTKSPGQVTVLSIVTTNSSKALVALPAEAARVLVRGFEQKDPVLQAFLEDIPLLSAAFCPAPMKEAQISLPVHASPSLNLTGAFYPAFTSGNPRYSDADRTCITDTVRRLLTVQTSADRPGVLLGKIQSGKTKTFLGAVALAFDNGTDIAIVLTKGTKALARQTLERVRREFAVFTGQDQLQVHDIMTVPSGLTGWELDQKLIFVCKKQSDNMDRLVTLFRETYPHLASKRVLIVDDEADYASVGFHKTQAQGLTTNVTTQQIEELRLLLASSAFLQVTATPYALYLQPEHLVVSGNEFRPIRPAFTELVPVNPNYIGSDYYFDRSQEADTVASLIYREVGLGELKVLRKSDRRTFRVEECLTSPAIPMMRTAICNFIVGGIIRHLQDKQIGQPAKKFSFLVHTESQRAAHAWQEEIVTKLNSQLRASVVGNPGLLRQLLTDSYNDLAESIRLMGHYLPPIDDVIRDAFVALERDWVMITKVNSERQIEELLDNEGQLRLRTPLNIFIGGQILDRGVTIANLIGFFYGRRPQVYQQDTVLQHSRMFGFRPIQDLTVTRFYTERQIYDAMRRMHESDTALREAIERDREAPIIFIQRDSGGRIIECSPNKILVSNTTTLRPFRRILPIGFQSDYAVRTVPVVTEIDRILEDISPSGGSDAPVDISLTLALDLISRVEPTLLMAEEEGYFFDWDAARAALAHMSNSATNPANRGHVWCLVRRDRNLSRYVAAGSHSVYADAPDTTRTEAAVARQVAIDSPMLMLIRQNGLDGNGWRGTPFYWPVIMAQQNIRIAIFAHETTP